MIKKFKDLNEKLNNDNYLTVRKLKKELEKHPDDMLVGVYCWEEGDIGKPVITTSDDNDLSFRSGTIDEIYGIDDEILIIQGIN